MTHCLIYVQVVVADLFEYVTSETLSHVLVSSDG